MAEPYGIIATIDVFTRLATKIAKYISKTRHAPDDARELAARLEDLNSVLGKISSAHRDHDCQGVLETQGRYALHSIIEESTQELTALNTKMERLGGTVSCWERLRAGGEIDQATKTAEKLQRRCSSLIEKFVVGTWTQTTGILNTTNQAALAANQASRMANQAAYTANQAADTEQRNAVLHWLSDIDFANDQQAHLRRREPTTGQWLLDTVKYQDWTKRRGQSLFCPGIPGSGKTTLTAMVVDDLTKRVSANSSFGVAFVYYNFRRPDEEQRTEPLLTDILKQLARGLLSLPDYLTELYSRHRAKQSRPSAVEISTALRSVTRQYSRVFVIVDALDEAPPSDRHGSNLMGQLFSLQAEGPKANIFVTARHIPEIVSQYSGVPSVEIRARAGDVAAYVDGQTMALPPFIRDDEHLRNGIKETISDAADGLFLLAHIYVPSLKDQHNRKMVKTMLKRLRRPPSGSSEEARLAILEQAYTDALNRIKKPNSEISELAMRVLAFIALAKRPLSVGELQDALAVEEGASGIDPDNRTSTDLMVSACEGLVTIDHGSTIVRLVHYTTQEYLNRRLVQWYPRAEHNVAATCLTYLLFDAFESGKCATSSELDGRVTQNAFYKYAACNWGNHCRTASPGRDRVMTFFMSEQKLSSAAQALAVFGPDTSRMLPGRKPALAIAAYFGLEEATRSLLGSGPDQLALILAIQEGHAATVELLLDSGNFPPEFKFGPRGMTPLGIAARIGHAPVIQLLLGAGSVPDSQDSRDRRTALSWAAENGHVAAAEVLLSTGNVHTDSRDLHGMTPLAYAAQNGHVAVVELLLATGQVNVRSQNVDGQTLLRLAVAGCHAAVVQRLLETGQINVNLQDGAGMTALMLAVQCSHADVVRVLRTTWRADVLICDNQGRTAQSLAASIGCATIIELLS